MPKKKEIVTKGQVPKLKTDFLEEVCQSKLDLLFGLEDV